MHISLSSWFREYVYFPLGGSRVSKPRLAFNLLVVWTCTGIWHGANWNFLFWGLYYFAFLAGEKLLWGKALEKLPAVLRHGYTLLIVVVGWCLFAIEDLALLPGYLGALFGFAKAGAATPAALYYLRSSLPVLLVSAVAATPVGKDLWHKLPGKVWRVALPGLLLAGLVLCTAYLVDATYNPFLYFRF